MTQSDFGTIDPDTKGGAELATDLNGFRDAQNTNHAGTAAPSYVVTYQTWVDTDEALGPTLKMYDGTDHIPIFRIDTTNNVPLLPFGTKLVASSTGQTASVNGDDFVIEANANNGMSFIVSNTAITRILFGDTDNNAAAKVQYSHSAGRMAFDSETDYLFQVAGSTIITLEGGDLKVSDYDLSSTSVSGVGIQDGGSVNIQKDSGAAAGANMLSVFRGTTRELKINGDGDVQNTNNSYGAISDARFKKNVTPAQSQWDDVKAMELVNYQLSRGGDANDGDAVLLGMVAQQLQAAGMDGLVSEDESGMFGVKYSVALLKALGALQEAMGRIEKLEAKIGRK